MMNPGAAQRAVGVSEALQTRSSCRAFLPDAVPLATVRAIVEAARQSPSGGNLQPWQVYVLAGGAMARFRALLAPWTAAGFARIVGDDEIRFPDPNNR